MPRARTIRHLLHAVLLSTLMWLVPAWSDGGIIRWQDFSPDAFAQAKRDNKFILLNIDAAWSHWCHVMDNTTWSDENIRKRLETRFITLRADQAERPDLGGRYGQFGWPATVILNADGEEIIRRSGYISPQPMAQLLDAVIADPRMRASASDAPVDAAQSDTLSASHIAELERRHVDGQDRVLGGLNSPYRYLDADTAIWDLELAASGDQQAEQRARRHLDAATRLLDPAFGGAYRQSGQGDWLHPQFEKIIATQWDYLRVYSRACEQLTEKRYCEAATAVAEYVLDYLGSPGGAFYNSQSADLKPGVPAHDYFALNIAERLPKGLPAVDKHRYAGENGRVIEGLLALYRVTKTAHYLGRAQKALNWIHERRHYHGGGYRHDHKDPAGPYLEDTLYLARANLALFRLNGRELYRERAFRASQFIDRYFRDARGGFVNAVDNGTPLKPVRLFAQNRDAVNFFLDLIEVFDHPLPRELAGHGMRYLNNAEELATRASVGGILLLNRRFNTLSE